MKTRAFADQRLAARSQTFFVIFLSILSLSFFFLSARKFPLHFSGPLLFFVVLQVFSLSTPNRQTNQLLPLLDDAHAPPLGPVVPLEGDAPGDEGEQGVVPALLYFEREFFFFFVSVFPFSLSLSLSSLSLSLSLPPREHRTSLLRLTHHADPGARVNPRPALPHDDRPGPRRRAAAELDSEHLRELVAPIAGGAALLLRGAVFFVCLEGCVWLRKRERR